MENFIGAVIVFIIVLCVLTFLISLVYKSIHSWYMSKLYPVKKSDKELQDEYAKWKIRL